MSNLPYLHRLEGQLSDPEPERLGEARVLVERAEREEAANQKQASGNVGKGTAHGASKLSTRPTQPR